MFDCRLAGIAGLAMLGAVLALCTVTACRSLGPPVAPHDLDPRRIDALPPEEDQGMAGLPDHLLVLAPADYSQAVAVGPDGSVYFTEFRGTLNRVTPKGELRTVALGRGAAESLTVDKEGNVFVAFDSDHDEGSILRIAPDGEESAIVSGFTRVRQLACDDHGNVYFVLEAAGQIRKWHRTSGAVETILSGLNCPEGVVVGADGSLYYSEYGAFTGMLGDDLKPGSVHVLRPDGSVAQLAGGFWRARGLALTPSGDLFLATEANVWDQGNSGILAKISPDGQVERVLQGLDYPQFPSAGADGKVYFPVNRDNLILAYDPQAEFTAYPWPNPSDAVLGVSGGTWTPTLADEAGAPLKLTVQDLVFEGRARLTNPGYPMRIWVRIPAGLLDLSREQYPYPTPEHCGPGLFELPPVNCTRAGRVFVAPVRGHVRSRWPVRYNEAETDPNSIRPGSINNPIFGEGFSESPVAYLVYMEYPSPQ